MSSGDQALDALPSFSVHDDGVRLTVDTTVYSVLAVQKAAYRLARHFTAICGAPNGDRLPVCLLLAGGAETATAAVATFFRELTDEALREKIAAQTNDIRALLLAQAFSRTDLVRRE